MTTNKPQIVSWGSFYKGVMQDFGYNEEATKAAAELDFHGRTLSIEPLIRLSDYEALQAECEELRKDADRIDWLADPNNSIGNVQLPMVIVRQHLHSLRDAIDAAMEPPK